MCNGVVNPRVLAAVRIESGNGSLPPGQLLSNHICTVYLFDLMAILIICNETQWIKENDFILHAARYGYVNVSRNTANWILCRSHMPSHYLKFSACWLKHLRLASGNPPFLFRQRMPRILYMFFFFGYKHECNTRVMVLGSEGTSCLWTWIMWHYRFYRTFVTLGRIYSSEWNCLRNHPVNTFYCVLTGMLYTPRD